MIEVLNGNLTLGQLIAFRLLLETLVLLQLSTLWQGFQGVLMERLGDILNKQQ